MSGVQLPFISALLVLDSDGKRVAVKYWDPALFPVSITAASTTTSSSNSTSTSKPSNTTAAGASTTTAATGEQLRLQQSFEKKVFSKTARLQRQQQDGYESIPEVMLLDSNVLVYKVINDVIIYVVGNSQENELILQSVLQAIDETMANLLKNQVSKKTLVENLDLLLLSIDEIIDEGLILETDSNLVVGRVCMVGGSGTDKDVPISEQSFTQALQTARDQLVKSFR